MIGEAHRHSRVIDGVEFVLWVVPEAGRHDGVTDPEALARMQGKLTPHPEASFEQPLRLIDEAAARRIPRTDISRTTPMPGADADLEERSEGAGRLWEIDTGHDLMFTEPEAVAEMLARLPSL